jgi:hypothetical protein
MKRMSRQKQALMEVVIGTGSIRISGGSGRCGSNPSVRRGILSAEDRVEYHVFRDEEIKKGRRNERETRRN